MLMILKTESEHVYVLDRYITLNKFLYMPKRKEI